MRKPKIGELSNKYGFSLNSKEEIEHIMKQIVDKTERYVIYGYYRQRLPIEISKKYLQLDKKMASKMSDNEILKMACIRHQKELLKNYQLMTNIRHIIDGIEYSCRIRYGDIVCQCGIKGYEWTTVDEKEYSATYWLAKNIEPMITIKTEPILTMVEEYNIIKNYAINIKDFRPQWIHSRIKEKRIAAYKIYYLKYWQWEHLEGELMPSKEEEWIEYFSTTGCANHRDLIETMHIVHCRNKKDNIDFRYGITFRL